MKRNKITIKSAKAKGRRLQNWTAEKISQITGYEFGKDKPIEPRPMGQSGTDVRLESNVYNLFPFYIECKFQEHWNIPEWIEQAKKNSKNNHWLLICKKSRSEPVIVLDANLFFSIYEELIKSKK